MALKRRLKDRVRNGLVKLASATTLGLGGVGCSTDNSVSPVPSSPTEDIRERLNESEAGRYFAGNISDEDISGVVNRLNSAGKATGDIVYEQVTEHVGDFDGSHRVDFDDFFKFVDAYYVFHKFDVMSDELKARYLERFDDNGDGLIDISELRKFNLDGDKYMDIDDFYIFADNFAKYFNMPPIVEVINGPENLVAGQEGVFTATVSDYENDELNNTWYVNGVEVESDNGELRHSSSEDFSVGVKVDDGVYGGESDLISRVVDVEVSKPILSLPGEISFDQYDGGENVYRLSLDDYVNDPDVTWSFDVEDNSFDHTKENTAPFGQRLRFPYTARALNWEIDEDGNFEIDPVGNYNSSDHDYRWMDFSVTNSSGESDNQRVRIEVVRNPQIDDDYDDFVTGMSFKESPLYFKIWTGQGRSEEGEALREGRGPYPTEEEISEFRRIGEEIIPQISDPVEIMLINDYDEWIREPERSIYYYINEFAKNNGGTVLSPDAKQYDLAFVGVNSKSKNNRFWSTCLHELTHAFGFDHPFYDRSEESKDKHIFIAGTRLEYVTEEDEFLFDMYREAQEYEMDYD